MRKPFGLVTLTGVLLGLALAAWLAGRGSPPLGAAASPGEGGELPEGLPRQQPATLTVPAGAAPQETAGVAGAGAQALPAGQAAPAVTAEQAIADHEAARLGPRQPIPFNHQFHSTELQIDCMYCHAGTERSSMGVVPALEVCMGCHRIAGTRLEPIQALQGYWQRAEPVPWEWVTRLPDFVQFSHRAHLRNGLECAECHGPVEEMARVYRWAPLTMGWCLECHRSQPAETDVATDYRLVRENPPPPSPGGRQPNSFYPVTIDQKYGAYRAPIDCLACHY